MTTTSRTTCLSHCHDGCAILAQFQDDGQVILTGHPDQPYTAGFICAKMRNYVQDTLRRPDRITTPLIKKDGAFQEASWDEAMDLIAQRLLPLRAAPERVLHHLGFATFGVLYQASKYVFSRLGQNAGAASLSGGPCVSAMNAAINKDFGVLREPHWSTPLKAARIVLWGRNLAAQTPHMGRVLQQAQKQGASVLAIHPGDSGYAPFCDESIILRPGSDRFLAAAVLKVMQEDGTLSQQALSRCSHVEAFLDVLRAASLPALTETCGVAEADIRRLADWYAKERTCTVLGRGLQRYALGGENVRWVNALAMASGAVGQEGAGLLFVGGDKGHVDYGWVKPAHKPARVLPYPTLAQAMEEAHPPIEFHWSEGCNPIATAPDAARLQRAFSSCFMVAVEPFMTDTAACATVILPPALLFEYEDIARAAGHEYVCYASPILAAPAGVRSNFAIAAMLAERLSMDFPDAETVLAECLATATPAGTLDQLREQGWLQAQPQPTPWADGQFATKDGRFNLVRQLTPEPPAPEGYPLRLLTLVEKGVLLSRHSPEAMEAALPTARIGPSSPMAQTLDMARPAELVTSLGRMAVQVVPDDALHPEAVLVPRGGWLSRGWGVNALIAPQAADMGGQAAYYAQWCRLEQ